MSTLKDLSSRWWFQILLLWFGTFILLNITGMIGARLLDLREGAGFHQNLSLYNVPGIWVRWDAGYYMTIAEHGYEANPGSAGFFPFYPMLVNLVNRITGVNVYVAGMIVSNISFLASTLIFYKIARLIKDDHLYAMQSVLAMLLFPVSFFYFALYAESLYLLLSLLGVYMILKNQRFVGSGIVLGLASLARPVGWLVDIVMLGEFIRRRRFDVKNIMFLGLGLFLSILGVLLYVYYLYTIFGTFLAIPNAQSHWPRHWQFPWITYWEGIRTLMAPRLIIRENWFAYAINAMDLLFTSFAAFVILISFSWARRNEFPWSLSIYSSVALLFFLSSQNELPTPMWGMSRWVGSLFPLYFVLGNMFKSKKIRALYYLGSTLLLVFFTAWWTSGRWIG